MKDLIYLGEGNKKHKGYIDRREVFGKRFARKPQVVATCTLGYVALLYDLRNHGHWLAELAN